MAEEVVVGGVCRDGGDVLLVINHLSEVVAVIRLTNAALMEPVLTPHAHVHVILPSVLTIPSITEAKPALVVMVVHVFLVEIRLF